MTDTLRALGSGLTTYKYDSPDPAVLETFAAPLHGSPEFYISIEAPEFTCLCPKTGQPDYATVIVKYSPREVCLESKSFKLYLNMFRMFGEFHEACVVRIANDLITRLDPEWLEVEGQFAPRGGITFWPKFIYNRRERMDRV